MKCLVLLGRILFALIFVMSAPGHFTKGPVEYASSHGVPMAAILVPISGILALAGGLSVMVGYRARWGALLLVLFLIPVTFMMHNFWAISDPQMVNMQRISFMKNMSMLGGALMIMHFGAGPISLDSWRRTRKAQSKDSID